MKSLFPDVVGNDELRSRIGNSLLSPEPTLSHAYIIDGKPGSGKRTFARAIAAAVACENKNDASLPLPCGECLACRKILRGISPDIIELGREGDRASLGIDRVRELRSDVHIYPNELDVKIYIINDFHTMTPQAQNAFLLTLEEPPAYAMFLLLCCGTGNLLETVRSRAPVLRMQPLTPEQTSSVVLSRMPAADKLRRSDPDRFNGLIMATDGSAGRAIELIGSKEGNAAAARREAALRFCTLAHDVSAGPALLTLLTASCGGTRESAVLFMTDLLLALRDLTALKRAEDAPLRFYHNRDAVNDLCDRYPLRRLLMLCDAVREATDALQRNMNVRLTAVSLLSGAGYFN